MSTFDPCLKGSRPLKQQQIGIDVRRKVHLDHANVVQRGWWEGLGLRLGLI